MTDMIEVDVATAEGAVLDWLVAKVVGCDAHMQGANDTLDEWLVIVHRPTGASIWTERWSPSTDWSQGGPLIERYRVTAWSPGSDRFGSDCGEWTCSCLAKEVEDGIPISNGFGSGPTVLIAAMRAIIVSQLGDRASVPATLAERGGS